MYRNLTLLCCILALMNSLSMAEQVEMGAMLSEDGWGEPRYLDPCHSSHGVLPRNWSFLRLPASSSLEITVIKANRNGDILVGGWFCGNLVMNENQLGSGQYYRGFLMIIRAGSSLVKPAISNWNPDLAPLDIRFDSYGFRVLAYNLDDGSIHGIDATEDDPSQSSSHSIELEPVLQPEDLPEDTGG